MKMLGKELELLDSVREYSLTTTTMEATKTTQNDIENLWLILLS